MKNSDLINIERQFLKIEDSDTKELFYVVLTNPIIKELEPILVRNDIYDLGFVSIYEIRGGNKGGILMGYAFYTKQNIDHKRNYLMIRRGKVDSNLVLKTQASLELKYKIDCFSIFTIGNCVLVILNERFTPLIDKLVDGLVGSR